MSNIFKIEDSKALAIILQGPAVYGGYFETTVDALLTTQYRDVIINLIGNRPLKGSVRIAVQPEGRDINGNYKHSECIFQLPEYEVVLDDGSKAYCFADELVKN